MRTLVLCMQLCYQNCMQRSRVNAEGQTPDSFPDTFCSIHQSNKNKVKFVQGRYNMGGTGTLRFCGDQGIQLIVSRRDPAFGEDPAWGFTVFRKLPPAPDERNPYWAYLVAPADGRDGTPPGRIIRFVADRVKLLPGGAADGGQRRPWTVPVKTNCLPAGVEARASSMEGGAVS